VRELGADEVINYRSEDVFQRAKAIVGDRGIDAIIDNIGSSNGVDNLGLLGPEGGLACGTTGRGARPRQNCCQSGKLIRVSVGHIGPRPGELLPWSERSPLEARDYKATRLYAFFDSRERKYFITPQKRRTGDRGGQIERRKRRIMDLHLQSERRLRGPAAPPPWYGRSG
jgi:NADPH:quinone reductase-like Zn-dependent oxidoreductase